MYLLSRNNNLQVEDFVKYVHGEWAALGRDEETLWAECNINTLQVGVTQRPSQRGIMLLQKAQVHSLLAKHSGIRRVNERIQGLSKGNLLALTRNALPPLEVEDFISPQQRSGG